MSTRNYLATGIRGTRAIDSVGHQFEWHNSAAAIDATHEKVLCAIDEVSDRYSIHTSRIVLAGYRSGGTMAMRIALRDPMRFAGVASFGGRVPQGGCSLGSLDLIRERAMPMLWQCALESPEFSPEALNADIRQALLLRAKVDVRQYKNDDEMNTAALADFNQWMMNRVVLGNPMTADEQWESGPVCFSAN
ncbi:MAG: alpha/beta hydrolase [Pirellulaceae bacterium]|nr:alpha/beta hydrolase [Pirellulaceae bacterium]